MSIISSKKVALILDSKIFAVRKEIMDYAAITHEQFRNDEESMTDEEYAKILIGNLYQRLKQEYSESRDGDIAVPSLIDEKLYMLANYHHFLGELKGIVRGYSESKKIVERVSSNLTERFRAKSARSKQK